MVSPRLFSSAHGRDHAQSERADQGRLAVVDMTGGPDHRHRLPGAGCGEGWATTGSCSGSMVQEVDHGGPASRLPPPVRPGGQQPRPYQVGSGPIHHHQRGWDATAGLSRGRQRIAGAVRPSTPADARRPRTPLDLIEGGRPSATAGSPPPYHPWRKLEVAPSAPSTGPPHRSALAAGCRCSRATRSSVRRPLPGLGPPSSLSPENRTRSAPVSSRPAVTPGSRRVWPADSTAEPWRCGVEQPLPASNTTGMRRDRPSATKSASVACSVKPSIR